MRLTVYIVRRLLILIPTLLGVTFITFILSHAFGPNLAIAVYCNPKLGACSIDNPRLASLVAQFHLRDPLPVQYVYYMQGLLSGDWGFSSSAVSGGITVTQAIILFFPQTLELALTATVVAVFVGIPTGTLSAVKKDKIADHATRIFALTGYAIPFFLLALLFQLAAIALLPSWSIAGIFDPSLLSPNIQSWAFITLPGGSPQFYSQPTHILVIDAILHGDGPVFWDALKHLILPTLTLAFGILGVILRMVRSGMVDSMNQDYVRTAWSKGLPEWVVVKKHIRRNALLPAATVIGLLFASLLGGVVLVETVFVWSGIGLWTTKAILQFDAGGIMGTTLIFAIFLVLINLIVDVVYAYLDPRITL